MKSKKSTNMNNVKVQLIQTRSRTPNHYLFNDIRKALNQFSEIESEKSGILGRIQPESCDLTIFFGGEEITSVLLKPIVDISKKSVLWLTEDPYMLESNLKLQHCFDTVYTTDHASASIYSNGVFLPLGTRNLCLRNRKTYITCDFLFYGALWPNRLSFFEKMLSSNFLEKHRGIILISEDSLHLNDQNTVNRVFRELNASGTRVEIIKRPFGLEKISRFIQNSQVILQIPRMFEKVSHSSLSPRLFEAGITGAFQVADSEAQPDLAMLFPAEFYLNFNFREPNFELLANHIEYAREHEFLKPVNSRIIAQNHMWENRLRTILDRELK